MDRLVKAGAEVLEAAKDVGGGRVIAVLKDAEGNIIGLVQDQTRTHTGSEWKVRR